MRIFFLKLSQNFPSKGRLEKKFLLDNHYKTIFGVRMACSSYTVNTNRQTDRQTRGTQSLFEHERPATLTHRGVLRENDTYNIPLNFYKNSSSERKSHFVAMANLHVPQSLESSVNLQQYDKQSWSISRAFFLLRGPHNIHIVSRVTRQEANLKNGSF